MLLYQVLLSSLATRLLKTLLPKKLLLLLKKYLLLPKKLLLLLKKLLLLLPKKLLLLLKLLLLPKKLLPRNNLDISYKEFEAVFHQCERQLFFYPPHSPKIGVLFRLVGHNDTCLL